MKYNSDIYNARNAIDRIEKQTLNEKPYGFLDRMKDAAVTAFGSDAASAQAQGSAITKKRATDLYNAMKINGAFTLQIMHFLNVVFKQHKYL